MNSRRTFIAGLAASGALSPLHAMAQPATKVWRAGFLAQRRVDFVDADSGHQGD